MGVFNSCSTFAIFFAISSYFIKFEKYILKFYCIFITRRDVTVNEYLGKINKIEIELRVENK